MKKKTSYEENMLYFEKRYIICIFDYVNPTKNRSSFK